MLNCYTLFSYLLYFTVSCLTVACAFMLELHYCHL